MPVVRPPTFAQQGWYDAEPAALASAVKRFLQTASNRASTSAHADEARAGLYAKPSAVMGVIAPHAGLRFGGPTAGVAYNRLVAALAPAPDEFPAEEVAASKALRRVVVLGPSHRAAFKGVGLSGCDAYDTPLGTIPVDIHAADRLRAELDRLKDETSASDAAPSSGVRAALSRVFGSGVGKGGVTCPHVALTPAIEAAEHSLEMQTPFIGYALARRKHLLPDAHAVALVPLMVGHVTAEQEAALGLALRRAFFAEGATRDTLVCVSSDFCHWGQRFGYQHLFEPGGSAATAPTRFDFDPAAQDAAAASISQRIELMDHDAMAACAAGDADGWAAHFERTQNTVCGRRPIGAVLRGFLAGAADGSRGPWRASWVHYDQSSACQTAGDSSVSYASAVLWQAASSE